MSQHASRPAPAATPTFLPPPTRPRRGWRHETFRALRHRNYRLYFCGQLVSLTGTWVQTAALTWLAYDRTPQDKALWAALVVAAQVLPTLLLGPWGGALADRFPKRPLLLVTQSALLALALGLAAVVAAGSFTAWTLLAFSALAGVVNAIDLPARLAFVMDMVGRDDLHNAVALNSFMFNAARVVGPAVGAGLLHVAGPALCFALNALSFVAVLAALAAMDPSGFPAARPRPGSVLDGFRYVAGRPALLRLFVLTGAVAFFGWPILSLLTAVADSSLHANADGFGYGVLLSAFGVGALPAALAAASHGTAARRPRFLAAGVALAASGLLGLALAGDLPPAAGCCALLGAGLILFNATSQTAAQLSAGDHNRGRVMAAWSMTVCAASPLGGLAAGLAADRWGVPAVLGVQALGVAAAAAAVLALARAARARAAAE
jgi:MFS family permease